MKKLFNGDFYTDSFHFYSDPVNCIHCHACIKTCSSAILCEDANGMIQMKAEADGIAGWAGCYRCQHCLAVCPTGAISIMGKMPYASPYREQAASPAQLDALMRNRRACRNYLDKEIPRYEIDDMLRLLENVPTGSNRQSLEFSVVYEKAEMDKFRKAVRDEAMRLASEGIYPGKFSKEDFEKQLEWEPARNPGDMFFVNAPHLLIIHAPKGVGCWHIDPILAAAWFDLICESRGYGCIMMTYPVGALSHMPELEKMLGISEDRHYPMVIGFGYPSIQYQRGVQREGIMKTHEIRFPELP